MATSSRSRHRKSLKERSNGFQRNPFSQQHTFNATYAFATTGFRLDYLGEFANFFLDWNLSIGGTLTNDNYAQNFFGYGNETFNFQDEYNYNRVGRSIYSGHVGILKHSSFGSNYGFKVLFEGIELQADNDRFITDIIPASDEEFYERKYFAALEADYDYLSADNKINPAKAMKFNINLGGRTDLQDADGIYGYINSGIEFYNALVKSKKFVLRTSLQTQLRFGSDYFFYQAAQLGGETGLRGYRAERFTGRNSLVGGADLRYYFPSIKTSILPLQIGVFAGGDVGRVWIKNDLSDKWHNDYGGGIRITAAESLSGTFSLFKGNENARFSFGLGLNFYK